MAAHNSFWRRLRRRYRYHLALYVFNGLNTLVVLANLVAWHLPHWRHAIVAVAARWIWIGISLAFALIMAFATLMMGLVGISGIRVNPVKSSNSGVSVIVQCLFGVSTQIGIVATLILGRIDLAICCEFLADALMKPFRSGGRRAGWQLPEAVFDLLIVASIPLRSLWLGVIGIVSRWHLIGLFVRSGLRRGVAGKPSEDEYLEQMRQAIAQPYSGRYAQQNQMRDRIKLLELLCDLERWRDAQNELSRIINTFEMPPDKRMTFQARIDFGMERYDRVVHASTGTGGSDTAEFKALLARAYARLGRMDDARHVAADLATQRHFGRARFLGDISYDLGEYEAALAHYERDVQMPKGRWAVEIGGLARTLAALGDFREATGLFREVLVAQPYRNSRILQDLADCYGHLSNEELASEAESLK